MAACGLLGVGFVSEEAFVFVSRILVSALFNSCISVVISSFGLANTTESNVRPQTTNTAHKKNHHIMVKEVRVQLYGDRRETTIRDPPDLITRPKKAADGIESIALPQP